MHALYDQQTAAVVTTWGAIPPQVIWPDGAATHGAAAGHVHADRWALVEAVYVDAGPPSPHHTEASRSSAYANGRVEVTRVWQAPADLTPIMSAKIADAKARVAARADEIATLITGIVPLAERLSWPTKEVAARAVLAGTATAGQQLILGAEAQVSGETVAALAARIVANADTYMAAAGLIAGQRRKTMAAIDALADLATFDADLAAIFATAEQEAQALLASL